MACEIVKSDDPILNKPVLDAAWKLEFSPAYKGKEPVAAWLTFPFRFRLTDSEKEVGH
jgi:hypothetical protein